MKPLDSDKKVSKEVSAPVAAAQAAPEVPEKIDFSNVEIEPLFADFVDFDTFSKSDFRAVKVKACEAVKKSKKLLKFTLDDGTGEDRVILSGIHLKAFVKGVRGYFSYYLRRFSLCFCLNNAFQPVLRSQTATMVKKHFDFIICFALLNHKNSIRFVFLRMVIWGG